MRLAVHHEMQTMSSSTLLSVLVQMNFWFSTFIFVIIMWAVYAEKLSQGMSDLDRVWYGAILGIWMLTEAPRLHLAQKGNSTHSVAHLLGFLVLTFVTHLTCMIVLNLQVPKKHSLDYAVSVMQLFFGVCEAVVAIATLRRIIRRNTVDFYVHLGQGVA